MKKILIATATFNEALNIKKLINKIINLNIKLDILVVDDKSPDKTWLILKKLKEKYKNLHVIIRARKNGLDSAHKKIYEFAIKNKYQYLKIEAGWQILPMEQNRKLRDHYQDTHEHYIRMDKGFEINIHPSLLLYFGKTAFMTYVNYEDLTEYFTKTGTIRTKFNYRWATKKLHEFIFKLIGQVKNN